VEGATRRRTGGFFFSGQFSAVRFKANRETGHDAIGGADPRGARASARGDGRRLARKPSRASRTRRRGVVAREIAPCLAAARARRGEPWRREAAAAPRAAAGATHAAGISTIVRGASAFAVSGRREVRRRPFPCVGGTRERRKALGRAVRSVRGREARAPPRRFLDEPDKKRPGDGKNSSRRPGVGQMSGAPFRRSRNRRFADVRLRVSSTRLFLGAGSSCAALRATPPGCLPR
jgi:hypothetical protein